ncbi:S1C family serine protease [Streptacidiphilus jiangxiensis]|uniref:Serine protease, S1-C subfamily, contains C-terminal PDZ domain n=1 Tax=Streptacidiphilus jiangxiensis TaxID=235985 RepID=A0A1H7TIR1_STRJI|nr:trypsin-like peptidase domain-containing protein [Streptacidiphilus jiangxiensis]SEL84613.1 serine protease, S1-C subfamily, contains C-terminal PDZ domain [Streptacidiphilus jiangxiensis]
MKWSAAGLATCAVAVALGTAGCSFTSSSAPSSSPPTAPASTASGGTGTTGTTESSQGATLAQVAAGSVDLVSEQGLAGTEAAGTGIVLTPDGIVLTNNHVINGATSLTGVDIGNGHSYTASVIGYDRSHDLALVRLHGASGLATLSLAPGARVSVGDAVTALGNAGGRGGQPARASGSVTALDQQIVATDEAGGSSEQLTGLIQVDAPIQAGDSGGPLVNATGQVIGIDTAASVGYHFSTTPTQGFAIPAAQAQSTADAIEAGRASATVHLGATAWLGVAVETAGQGAGGGAGGGGGGGAGGGDVAGATIAQVVPGSPAAGLGLASGDVITALGGAPVADPNGLTALMDRHHPGDTVTLAWTDAFGQSQSASLQLGSGPAG